MENSILKSTKKILGLPESYTPFDLDIITHINAVFLILNQLGLGLDEGFMIENETAKWADFGLDSIGTNAVRSYVYLKVRMMFDPPTTSYLIEAMNKQIAELEWRLNVMREEALASEAL